MFGFGSKKEIEALRREIAELKDQQGPSHDEVEALRAELREVQDNPVVALVRQVEQQMPHFGRIPRWIAVLLLTGAIGSVATFVLIYWQVSLFRDQLVQQEQLMQQQSIQFREQMVIQKALLKKQDAQIERQDRQLQQQAVDTSVDQAITLRALELQQRSNQLTLAQNNAIAVQAELIQTQVNQAERRAAIQRDDRLVDRRTELLAIILDRDCDLPKSYDGTCRLKASKQNRELAIRALIELDNTPVDLSGGDLSHLNLAGFDLSEANLQGTKFFASRLDGADLSNANLRSAKLRNARLTRATLIQADLQGADLRESHLGRADLRGARLSEANLSEANLEQVDLSNSWVGDATFKNARLYGAVFQFDSMAIDAGPSQFQLTSACGDSTTVIPEYRQRPPHWLDRPRGKPHPDWHYQLTGESRGCPSDKSPTEQ